MPRIEIASRSDGPSIIRITANAGVFTPIEISTVEDLWNDYLAEGETSGYVFLVSREDGDDAVMGYTCFGPHSLTQGTYDLYWIAVDASARARGIGHALIAAVEEQVRRRGGRLLLIETSDTAEYAPARDLYSSSGYHVEATIRNFYAPHDNLVVFAKDLQSLHSPPS